MDTQILLNFLNENTIVSVVTAVVTIFSAISAVTGTPPANTLWGKLYKLVDFLSLNVLKAKDK